MSVILGPTKIYEPFHCTVEHLNGIMSNPTTSHSWLITILVGKFDITVLYYIYISYLSKHCVKVLEGTSQLHFELT